MQASPPDELEAQLRRLQRRQQVELEQQEAEVRRQLDRLAELEAAPAEGARSNIVDFYHNRSVLITGASGFIGKVLIEKLLRSCPSLRHIFVLIRPKRNKQPGERLEELLRAPLFDQVRDGRQSKVILVEGDITGASLGMSEPNVLRIMSEVSVIFHSAATVKFDEPLKKSVEINLSGTRNLVELCRKIPQLAALVHVSTAYANCDRQQIDELVYPVKMEPEKVMEMASWLDQDTMQELKRRLLDARPNTYTYTKALAEWLLVESARDLPVVICRPSIVVASWREPFSGWVDNLNGPTGTILGAGKGLIRSMCARPEARADMVPVDVVINMVIALGWFAHVYHRHKLSANRELLAGDSASESSASSPSSYSLESPADPGDDSLDEFADQLAEMNQKSAGKDFSISTNNNNNNNNQDSQDQDNNNNSNHLQDAQVEGGKQATVLHDLGYVSASQTPDAKSAIDSSLSSDSSGCSRLCSARQSPDSPTFMGAQQHSARQEMFALAARRQLAEQSQAAFEYKLKQFRHNCQRRLANSGLPEQALDVPVFHCTSSAKTAITWHQVQLLIMTLVTVYPSVSIYRYPNGAFTANEWLHLFYRLTLHYVPAYIMDACSRLTGAKARLVHIYRQYDQAAEVLKVFLYNQWCFKHDNRTYLIDELMSARDKQLFNCDTRTLEWDSYMHDYVLGVRRFVLKEPMSNLAEARRNMNYIYVRNLSVQLLLLGLSLYYFLRLPLVSGWLFA